MKFDEKLQKLRKASGLSQEALADKLNISRQAVSKWESGVSYPETDKLIQMSKIFNCSLDELVNDTETDKSIYSNQQKKKNMYLDSLMEFITKSVNMFSNMKFSNVIKALIELFIVGVIILVISLIAYSLGDALLNELFWNFYIDNNIVVGIIDFISSILEFVWLLIIVAIALIVFIQIYKIRYLDYYDKLVYEYEQKEELKNSDINEDDKEVEDKVEEDKNTKKSKKERIKLEDNKRDRIIIRDPKHRPFAFLGAVSNVVIKIVKFFAGIFSIPFICSLIFFVISFVISIYLITINKLFIGVLIALVGALVFNVLVLEMLYKFITSININKKRIFVEGLLCIIVSSIGVGIFFINLKDIEFLEYSDNEFVMINEVVEYNSEKNTLDIINHPYSVSLVVDDSIKENLVVSFDYNKDIHCYEVKKDNNHITLDFEPKAESIHEVIDMVLTDLKNNKIRLYDYYDYPYVQVRGNEKDIKSLVLYMRDQEGVIYTDDNADGIYHAY